MKIRNLNIIMMLTAGVIVSIVYLVKNYSLLQLTYAMLIVMIIFYIIGSIIQYFINHIILSIDNQEIVEREKDIDEKISNIDNKTEEENVTEDKPKVEE